VSPGHETPERAPSGARELRSPARFLPPVTATAVGDVPHEDPRSAVEAMLALPDLPAWPQLPRRSPREGMIGQFASRFPFLQYRRPTPRLSVAGDAAELEAAADAMTAAPLEEVAPALDARHASGLYAMLERLGELGPERRPACLKGQITGPVTLASLIADVDGRPLVEFPRLMPAVVRFLAAIAIHQVRAIREAGCRPVLFVDEPLLARRGLPADARAGEAVVVALQPILAALAREGAAVGVQWGGRVAWPAALGLDADWIGFETELGFEGLAKRGDELIRRVEAGRGLAFGSVPVRDLEAWDADAAARTLIDRLVATLGSLEMTRRLLARSLVLPTSGTMMRSEIEDRRVRSATVALSSSIRSALDLPAR